MARARLGRRLLTIGSTASLLICIAASGMWARSIWRGDLLRVVGDNSVLVHSEPGLIFIEVLLVRVIPAEPRVVHDSWPQPPSYSPWKRLGSRWWQRLGFGHHVGQNPYGQRVDQFVFPYYFIVALTALPPAGLLVQRVRTRRRSRQGLCPRCRYDLRATPERCPECGWQVPAISAGLSHE